ncbi:NADH dehydrogenase [ubiquinone] 1 subunit C2-like [Denticeps clupeoides]|uniref:NADH dehydrogenase [ubiquinone] 1 subunit C2 n=1 Tax=Denticeps clupeoides TaxID=299321 RepID=A0A8C4AG61_9TELE|nr:NADH dehydrogenase [ubiquinone] 1 subunit C2-like [Denticeps clupeoides]XP_028856280.1 NADH dehydrogenase [ubiquinone] 1 subunit C2-like [Denticeps clupeoides]
MVLLPEEAKALPPPGVVNRSSLWLGFCGLLTSMLHNSLARKPALRAGLHRHVLFTTVGWFLGYHLTKYENYTYARLDRDMNAYVSRHPEEFQQKEKKTFAEVVEDFHPIR